MNNTVFQQFILNTKLVQHSVGKPPTRINTSFEHVFIEKKQLISSYDQGNKQKPAHIPSRNRDENGDPTVTDTAKTKELHHSAIYSSSLYFM